MTKNGSSTFMMILSRRQKKSKLTQTDAIDYDGLSTLYSENPNEKYWEMRSEQQRIALGEALKENEQLANELSQKDEEIKDLKSKVEELEETSSYAFKLASYLEELDLPSGLHTENGGPSSPKKENEDDDGEDCNESIGSFQSINTTFSDIDDEDKENIPPEELSDACEEINKKDPDSSNTEDS